MIIPVSTQVLSIYTEPYDKTLDKLSVTNPNKSLVISKQNLLDAEMSGDYDGQLESIYYILSSSVLLSNSSEVDKYIEMGLSIANATNNIRYKTEFIGYRALQHELRGNYNSAVIDANKALRLSYEINDNRLIAEALTTRSEMYLGIENYDLALTDIQEALAITKANEDDSNTSINYNLLAIIYVSLGEFDNAIKYYQESAAYDKVKSEYDQASLQYNIGAAYTSKRNYSLALKHYNVSKDISVKLKDDYSIAFVDFGMAEVYLIQKNVEKSEASLYPVFEIFKSRDDILMLFNSNLLMAEIKTLKKDYTLALAYLDKAEQQVKVLNTPSSKFNLLERQIDLFTAQENWKSAFELKIQINKLERNLQEKSKEKTISELKIMYNAQFDQEKLEMLQNQNLLQQEALVQEQVKQKYLWGLIGLGVILLLFSLLGYKKQKKIKRHLYSLSITDYLTQVSNRRHIIEKLKALHGSSLSGDSPFAVIMIDLDFFKKINDAYGHDVGNEVLIYFAKTAKEVMLGVGTVGRIGGEEWLILMPNTSFDFIRRKLEELRHAYKKSISLTIPKDCNLSFSSGVIMSSEKYQSHEQMLSDVDIAMYKAKKKGREQDVFVSASLLKS